MAERMVKDSAGQERHIKLGPKLWVSFSLCQFRLPHRSLHAARFHPRRCTKATDVNRQVQGNFRREA